MLTVAALKAVVTGLLRASLNMVTEVFRRKERRGIKKVLSGREG